MQEQKVGGQKVKYGKMSNKFILVMFFLLVVNFAILEVVIIESIKKNNLKTYSQNSTELVDATSQNITYWVNSLFNCLDVYTTNPINNNADVKKISEFIRSKKLVAPVFNYTGFCDKDGIMHTSLGTETNVSDRNYYKAIMKNLETSFIGNPVVSRTNGKAIFHVCKPAYDKTGMLFGFYLGTVELSTLNKITNSVNVGGHGYVYVVDSDGMIIAHPNSEFVMQKSYDDSAKSISNNFEELTKKMIDAQKGFTLVDDVELNQKCYVFYSPIKNTKWSIALSIPRKQVMSLASTMSGVIIFCFAFIGVVLLITCALFMSTSLKPLSFVGKTISSIADGDADLTKSLDVKGKNEIAELTSGFNRFVKKLHTIISRVKDSNKNLSSVDNELQSSIADTSSSITEILANIESVTKQVEDQSASVEETAGAVNQIAQNIESLEKMIQTQSSGVTQASAAVEEMIGNINSVDGSMNKMANAFSVLEENTEKGIAHQNSVNERIQQIESQSEMLKGANEAISTIATQTNLLAMNAAIEAAHAGEAGKGFSVVADEIRKLSETSSGQSKTIGSELTKISDSISAVVQDSNETTNLFNSVSLHIKQTDELVQQIKGAMQEQQTGSKQITQALQMMMDSTQEVRSASKEMSDGNKAILEEIKILQDATVLIKNSMIEMSAGAKGINQTGVNLTEISKKMESSIEQISGEIDLFKV